MSFFSRSPGRRESAAVLALTALALAAPAAAGASSPPASAAATFQSLRPQLPVPTNATATTDSSPSATASARCNAQILKSGKLVTLRTTTYKYKFVKIKKGRNKGKFQRTIVRVRSASP